MASDTLLCPRWIIPVEPAGAVLEGHCVALRDGLIEAVLPRAAAEVRFAAYEKVELGEHALIPGLVNAHTHAAMALMRGLADDLPLMRWLEEHIWPAETKHVSPQFVRDGTLLACAEMLRGGVTCFNDMYFFPAAALEAAQQAGMRVALGMIVFDFPSAYGADPDDYLAKGLALRDQWHENPLVSFCLAPHAPYPVSDATFGKVAKLAAEVDVPVHVHLHETEQEIERSLAEHGVRPLARLERLGLLGPGLIAVHAVHLDDPEIALLAKAVAHDAQALPAQAALRAATLGGARALGLEERIGSVEPGKCADLAAVRLDGPELSPLYDPVSQLVYAAGREHVSDVWIAGKRLLREGIVADLPLWSLDTRIKMWENTFRSRA